MPNHEGAGMGIAVPAVAVCRAPFGVIVRVAPLLDAWQAMLVTTTPEGTVTVPEAPAAYEN
jgi:hypothetical protein